MSERVVIVDDSDTEIGTRDKLEAHELGALHRAFSVLIYNSEGEFLLQRRAQEKYHSPGLWSNACCSHPRPGERIEDAVERRLMEELGLNCKTRFSFKFKYHVAFENGLIEHEIDHVFIGQCDHLPELNPDEVSEFRYISIDDLKSEIGRNPENFTFWLKRILEYDEYLLS